jgi:hypothetical protein
MEAIMLGATITFIVVLWHLPAAGARRPKRCRYPGRAASGTAVDQYGTTMAQWFGVPQNSLSTVFPNIVNFRTNPPWVRGLILELSEFRQLR